MPNGYPQDWILGGDDIAKDISDDMVCSICSDLKRDAVITDCKHSFCGDCIAAWFRSQRSGAQTCPNCRAPHSYTHLAPDAPMRAAIDAMQAKCPHCPFTDTLPSVFLHESNCTSRLQAQPTVAAVSQHHALTDIAQMQLAMEALRVQVGANGRSCRCRVCAATSDNRLSSFLTAATAAIELPATVVRLVVVQAPPGADFFFVAQEGAVRHRTSNAFIHNNTFTKIVNAIRSKFSCTDRTPVTRPAQGTVFVGVLGRNAKGPRVEDAATEVALTGRSTHVVQRHVVQRRTYRSAWRDSDTYPEDYYYHDMHDDYDYDDMHDDYSDHDMYNVIHDMDDDIYGY